MTVSPLFPGGGGGGSDTPRVVLDQQPPVETGAAVEIDCSVTQEQTFARDLPPVVATGSTGTTTAVPVPVDDELEVVEQTPIENPPAEAPQFLSPLRETHIFTPGKGAVAVSREIISSGGGVVDCGEAVTAAEEEITVKEYRDVEYDPKRFLDELLLVGPRVATAEERHDAEGDDDVFGLAIKQPLEDDPSKFSIGHVEDAEDQGNDDDDFTDFQSMPPPQPPPPTRDPPSANSAATQRVTTSDPLALLSVTSLSSMAKGMESGVGGGGGSGGSGILRPSMLSMIPQTSTRPGPFSEAIQWPDNSDRIAQSELERIEELFSSNKVRTATTTTGVDCGHLGSGAGVSNSSVPSAQVSQFSGSVAQTQKDEEDEWSDFVSVPRATVTQQVTSSPQRNLNTVSGGSHTPDDEWSDFVSSAPQPMPPPLLQRGPGGNGPNFTPWGVSPSNSQAPQSIPSRPRTHLPLPSPLGGVGAGGGGPEMQFVDAAPFFISSTGFNSVFGGNRGNSARK